MFLINWIRRLIQRIKNVRYGRTLPIEERVLFKKYKWGDIVDVPTLNQKLYILKRIRREGDKSRLFKIGVLRTKTKL